MISSKTARTLAALGLLVAFGAVAVSLQIYRERHYRIAAADQQLLYVQSPAVATRLALSYDSLAADVYWIRAIQHYGRTRLSANPVKRYDLLYPLLDLTTSLDPQFQIAYRFGAFFLSEAGPGGADRPDLAVRLLEKGMRANPDRWEYPYDIGFVAYRRGDYATAAAWFKRTAALPTAPNWVKPLAAVMLAAGGDLRSSRLLWTNLANADEDWLRRAARRRLQQLDALEAIGALQRLTAVYEQRHGDPPATWADMVRDGLLRDPPRDPAGAVYALNPYWGLVTLDEQSPLWPMPREWQR